MHGRRRGAGAGPLRWRDEATLGIVLASEGYPGPCEKGAEIRGAEDTGALVYHMGTALRDGRLVTAGGRVLIVVGRGATLAEARDRALEAAGRIGCDRSFLPAGHRGAGARREKIATFAGNGLKVLSRLW